MFIFIYFNFNYNYNINYISASVTILHKLKLRTVLFENASLGNNALYIRCNNGWVLVCAITHPYFYYAKVFLGRYGYSSYIRYERTGLTNGPTS